MKEQELKNAAFKKAESGDLEKAVKELKSLRLEKDEERLPFFFLAGLFDKAVSCAVRLSSKPLTSVSLTCLRNPWLYDFVRNENYERAVSFLLVLLKKLKSARLRGNGDFLRRHYTAALSFYLPGIDQEEFPPDCFYSKKFAWAAVQRGKAFLNEAKFEKALKDFKTAHKANPADWESGCLLAETFVLTGRKREGFSLFNRLLKGQKDETEKKQIAAWKAEFHLIAGEPQKTLAVFRQYPESFFSPCWQSAALYLCGKAKKAENILKPHIRKNPRDYEALFWLIEILIKKGDVKGAGKILKKLEIEKQKNGEEKHLWLVPVYRAMIEKNRINSAVLKELENIFGKVKFPASPSELLKKAKGCRRGEPYLISCLFRKKA